MTSSLLHGSCSDLLPQIGEGTVDAMFAAARLAAEESQLKLNIGETA